MAPSPETLAAVEAALAAGSAVVVASEDPSWGAVIADLAGPVALFVGLDEAGAALMGADLFPGRDLTIVVE